MLLLPSLRVVTNKKEVEEGERELKNNKLKGNCVTSVLKTTEIELKREVLWK